MTEDTPPPPKLTKAGVPKKSGGRRRGSGKKAFELTPARLKKIGKIAQDMGTSSEAAAELGISVATLLNRFKDMGMNWTEFAAEHKARGLIKLRRAQMKTALDGNPTMQIWLGKQLLDQKDKSEIGFDKDKPAVFRLAMGKDLGKDRDDGKAEGDEE